MAEAEARKPGNFCNSPERVVILGGGITGLTAGWELAKQSQLPVLIVEKEDFAGGLANSFTRQGLTFDFGSHRIHEQYDPEVFAIIKSLLGDDLLKRPRRGQIRVRGKFLDYPPSVFQILASVSFSDRARIFIDYLNSLLRRAFVRGKGNTFEEYATRAVGKCLYERFYKPYALKLWGVPPDRLSFEPAVSRVKKFEMRAVWGEVKRKMAGDKAGRFFYYPARGFGQIAERIRERFLESGGEMLFESTVTSLEFKNGCEIGAVNVSMAGKEPERIPAKLIISTAPIDVLYELVRSRPEGTGLPGLGLSWRSLRVLYIFTPDKTPSRHETYYFPEPDVIFGRVSEPAKYSPFLNQIDGTSALAIEVPCAYGDEVWNMGDDALAERCVRDLRKLGILSDKPHGKSEYFSRRIKNLYPIYEVGWREKFEEALRRFNSVKNLYLAGRLALFLHCNVDHCMAMALKLARLLSAEDPKRGDWEAAQNNFHSFTLHD